MVKINKRPTPPKPIKVDDDYRTNPNFSALVEDCNNKCYICEIKPTTQNVEHRIPHRGDPSLKYDWNNLFLACGHCNNSKLDAYDDILDPSKCDPEDYIALSLNTDSLVEEIIVEVLSDGKSATQTADLLERVYNGGTTDIKAFECANLRDEISDCILDFHLLTRGYRDEPDASLKGDYRELIKKDVSRSSTFAAFKRKLIRDDPELSAEFSESLT